MAIPDGLVKMVLSGTLATNTEKWAVSLWHQGYTLPGTGGSLDLAALVADPTWTAVETAIKNLLTNSDSFTAIDTYYYQGGVAVAHEHIDRAISGPDAVQPLPCQIACVLTLRTALSTRSGRGRIYLPVRRNGVTAGNGMFPSAGVNAAVDALALYATEITTGGTHHLVVVSQTHGSSQPVTSIDCDLVPDTQRRRRNKLVSARHSHAVLV